MAWRDDFLAPISDRLILQRMLNNLKLNYARLNDYPRLLRTIEYLLLLSPEAAMEIRDRGLAHSQLGHWQAALRDLQRYLDLEGNAPDARVIAQYIAALRQQLES